MTSCKAPVAGEVLWGRVGHGGVLARVSATRMGQRSFPASRGHKDEVVGSPRCAPAMRGNRKLWEAAGNRNEHRPWRAPLREGEEEGKMLASWVRMWTGQGPNMTLAFFNYWV